MITDFIKWLEAQVNQDPGTTQFHPSGFKNYVQNKADMAKKKSQADYTGDFEDDDAHIFGRGSSMHASQGSTKSIAGDKTWKNSDKVRPTQIIPQSKDR